MALVIETGSMVAGANSYADATFVRQYAQDRGQAANLPPQGEAFDGLLVLATDYLESFAADYVGERRSADQSLSWPRVKAKVNGADWPIDKIPENLKQAQAAAVVILASGVDLSPAITGYAVRREKVADVEVEYAAGGGNNTGSTGTRPFTPVFPNIKALLRPLLSTSLNGQLWTVRA